MDSISLWDKLVQGNLKRMKDFDRAKQLFEKALDLKGIKYLSTDEQVEWAELDIYARACAMAHLKEDRAEQARQMYQEAI